jgi:HK97 family phage major capsid protein
MGAPIQLTAEQVKGMIEDAIKEATGGLTLEKFHELRGEVEKLQKAQLEAERDAIAEVAMGEMPKKYARKAHHVIRFDENKGVGLRWARHMRAVACGKTFQTDPREVASKWWDDKELGEQIDFAQSSEAHQKALAAGLLASGGALIPEDFASEVIELLRASSTVLGAGTRVVPMRRGQLTMPKLLTGATSTYVGENQNITKSEQTFGQLRMVAHKLACLVPMSNDLLREADPMVDQLLRDDMAQSIALKIDLTALRGDGTQNEPKGLRYLTDSANINAQTAATLAGVLDDYFDAIRLVDEANVPLTNAAWTMAPRTIYGLAKILGTNDMAVFKDEVMAGSFLGFPLHKNNQIPTNLGGTDSESYFTAFNQFLMGDTMRMELQVFPGGAYYDGAQIVSGISTDQTVIRALTEHDFALRHDLANAVVTEVTVS